MLTILWDPINCASWIKRPAKTHLLAVQSLYSHDSLITSRSTSEAQTSRHIHSRSRTRIYSSVQEFHPFGIRYTRHLPYLASSYACSGIRFDHPDSARTVAILSWHLQFAKRLRPGEGFFSWLLAFKGPCFPTSLICLRLS